MADYKPELLPYTFSSFIATLSPSIVPTHTAHDQFQELAYRRGYGLAPYMSRRTPQCHTQVQSLFTRLARVATFSSPHAAMRPGPLPLRISGIGLPGYFPSTRHCAVPSDSHRARMMRARRKHEAMRTCQLVPSDHHVKSQLTRG